MSKADSIDQEKAEKGEAKAAEAFVVSEEKEAWIRKAAYILFERGRYGQNKKLALILPTILADITVAFDGTSNEALAEVI